MDEPTTGLHPSDCEKLMELFEGFADKGNTVIIIEHNLDVIKRADYIIDIGPDGGSGGGEVVFCGKPSEMAENSQTNTAKCLRMSLSGKTLTEEQRRELAANYYDYKENTEKEMQIKINPIGRIVSKEDGYYIALDTKYAPALEGLEGFSHIQVYWWFDGADTAEDRGVLATEKPYTKGPDKLGIFATRSPQRPNPIAVSTCGLIWLDKKNALVGIDYIDAFNATPVLDIKPYTPSLDRVKNPSVPEWCAHWPQNTEDAGQFDWESEFNF